MNPLSFFRPSIIPNRVSPGIIEHSDPDVTTYFCYRLYHRGLLRKQFIETLGNIIHAPENKTMVAISNTRHVGIKSQFTAIDIEANIEGFIKIRCNAGDRLVPFFGFGQVVYMVNNGS